MKTKYYCIQSMNKDGTGNVPDYAKSAFEVAYLVKRNIDSGNNIIEINQIPKSECPYANDGEKWPSVPNKITRKR